MIKIKFSTRKSVDVGKGLAKNWKRTFPQDDIRVPEGWVHALEVNGRMFSFAFAYISGAKIDSDNYIVVIDKFSREEALGGGLKRNSRWFVCRVMDVLRPAAEDYRGEALTVETYLNDVAVAKFSQAEMEEWRKEKKLMTC